MTNLQILAAPVGRLFIALIFLLSGLNKISAYEGMQGYMEAMGVPGFLLPFTIFFEVAFSIAIIIGWKTRLAAFALAGFSLLTALVFHFDLGDQMQFINFTKNIAIAGGFLFLVSFGAGAYSLDNRLQGKG